MSAVKEFRKSRARLRSRGSAFGKKTRAASTAFAKQTREASLAFAAQTRSAGSELISSVRAEAERLRGVVRSSRPQLPAPAEEWSRAQVTLQRRVLNEVRRVLGELDSAVGARLEELEEAPLAEAELTEAPPLADYDDLTAKEVVASLNDLSALERAAVIAYERAHKNRATVLRAAKKRAA